MTHEETEVAIERLRSMRTASRDLITEVCRAFLGGELTGGDELHYMLIELLEQADPDAHIELPRDVDGMPIHVGDVMCDEDGKSFEVDEMLVKANGWELYGGDYGEGFSEYDPATCRHYHKPTVEDVLRYVISSVVEYANEHRDKEVVSAYINDAATVFAEKIREVMADE